MKKHEEHTAEARVTITGGMRGGKSIARITVKDAPSGATVEVLMSAEEFGMAVTGHGLRHAEATWTVGKLGKTKQNKTETGVTKENLHEFEVDGWVARKTDLGNMHRRQKDNTFQVVFFRWVDAEEQGDVSSEPRCRYCGYELPYGEEVFCSTGCANAAKIGHKCSWSRKDGRD